MVSSATRGVEFGAHLPRNATLTDGEVPPRCQDALCAAKMLYIGGLATLKSLSSMSSNLRIGLLYVAARAQQQVEPQSQVLGCPKRLD